MLGLNTKNELLVNKQDAFGDFYLHGNNATR